MAADLPQTHFEPASHTPVTDTADTSPKTGLSSWLSGAAQDAWSAAKGAGRVAEDMGIGFAKQAYEHPGQTLAEIGAGAVVTAAATEVGLGVVGTAAIAALPAAAYGIYRGVDIARTEGIGAIPSHMEQTLKEAQNFVSTSAEAIGSVYKGGTIETTGADLKVEALGRGAVPLAAGALGGELGETVAQLGRVMSENMLPVLTLEPAYVDPIPAIIGGSSRGSSSLEAGVAGAATSGSGASILQRNDSNHESGGAQSEAPSDEYGRQQLFIEGRRVVTPATPAETSVGGTLSDLFRNPEQILSNGGKAGNIQLTKTPDGWLEAEFAAGPMQGTIALYKPGDSSFIIESSKSSQPHVMQLK